MNAELKCRASIYVCKNRNLKHRGGCSRFGDECISRLNELIKELNVGERVKIISGECSGNCKTSSKKKTPTIYVSLDCIPENKKPKPIHPNEAGQTYIGVSSDKLEGLLQKILGILDCMKTSPELQKRVLNG